MSNPGGWRVRRGKGGHRRCFVCNGIDHLARDCPFNIPDQDVPPFQTNSSLPSPTIHSVPAVSTIPTSTASSSDSIPVSSAASIHSTTSYASIVSSFTSTPIPSSTKNFIVSTASSDLGSSSKDFKEQEKKVLDACTSTVINTKYVDSHCHIDDIMEKLQLTSFAKLKLRYPPNFEYVINSFSDPASLSPSFNTYTDLLKDECIYASFGIHPHSAQHYDDKRENIIIELMKHPKTVAWGETGLDFFKNRSPREQQLIAFQRQLLQAVKCKKAVVVHSRSAPMETYNILKRAPKDWPIHLHCFHDSVDHAKKLLMDFSNLFIGVTGAITFSSAGDLRRVVAEIPLDHLLLETDGPYMAPRQANAAKGVCHSGMIPFIAEEIAQLKGVHIDRVYQQTRANVKRVYGI